MDPRNVQNQKALEVVEQLNLPGQEAELAKAYLSGEVGDEVLGKFGFRDLSWIGSDKSVRLFREFRNKGKKEEARRLFELLFAIGQSTCHRLIPMDMTSKAETFLECGLEKKVALYGALIGTSQYQWYGTSIRALISCAQGKLENLRRAIDYQKGSKECGKELLMAVYFMIKYGKWEERKSGLFGMDSENGDGQIREEDMPLWKEYVDCLVAGLERFFEGQLLPASIKEIQAAVEEDRITEEILRMAGPRRCGSIYLFWQIGGMAYLNFTLCPRLKNVVKVCMAVDVHGTLNAIDKIGAELPLSIKEVGGAYDRVFGIDSGKYIRWAAFKGYRKILGEQLGLNKEPYLKVMEEISLEESNLMFDVIREYEPGFYGELRVQRQKEGHNQEVEKILNLLVPAFRDAGTVRGYLKGMESVEALYPLREQFADKYSYGGYRESSFVETYRKNYPKDGFYRRCQVYMLLKGAGGFFRGSIAPRGEVDGDKVRELFRSLEQEGLAVAYQVSGLVMLKEALCYYEGEEKKLLAAVEKSFAGYLKERRVETVHAFLNAPAFGRFFGLYVMRKDAESFKQEILGYSQDSSKLVREELQDILYGQRGWEEEVKGLLASRKAGEREIAIRVLLHWQKDGSYEELFAQALEKERNNKVRELLLKIMQAQGDGTAGQVLSQEELVKEIHKGGKKRTLVWAYETPFSEVRKKDGTAAGEEYLQAILLCYASVDGCGVSRTAAELAQGLQPEELAVYVNELFDKWMAAGAEAKKRWVLYAAAIHGGFEIVKKLQHQLLEWPQQSRGAIAAEAVQALSLNPLPQALLIVDGISRKFKFKQVKAAAGKALEFAAAQLGVSREELADRIVPDLGFDGNGERSFDYGERQFKVVITPALEMEVYDGAGKKLKNMPAPGKRDEEAKAAAAYEEFKQMKKQMKMTISSQKMRLEQALSSGRKWDVAAWKRLFVENPVMHQFAIGLIWGRYEGMELAESFRYMEDGSFNTWEEEEYELPEDGKIGLVHPIELETEVLEAWKTQLEDYEIRQPLEQLERTVYVRTEEEAQMRSLERFGGYILNDLSLGGKLQGLGWYRGPVEDGGCFDTYYRVDEEAGIGIELRFSGSFIGGENEDVTVYDAAFYPTENLKGGYVYEKKGEEKSLFLKDIPARYFSEAVWQLAKATASSQGRNEDWKES